MTATTTIVMSPSSLHRAFENPSQKQQNAHALASGYGIGKRSMEMTSIFFFIVFWTSVSLKLSSSLLFNYLNHDSSIISTITEMVGGCIMGMIIADFISGVVHWACDTWGSVDKGPFATFIRSFREHHVDPLAITRHDFIEANGDNCLPVLPVLILLQYYWTGNSFLSLFILSLGLWSSLWISLTNQIHKWSHTDKKLLPSAVVFLQETKIILSRKSHKVHHMNPFDTDYCITTGWLNPLLTGSGFWKMLESIITKYTGHIPRIDDAAWTLQTDSKGQISPSSSVSTLSQSGFDTVQSLN